MRKLQNACAVIIIICAIIFIFLSTFVEKFDSLSPTVIDGIGRPLIEAPFFAKYFLLQGNFWAGWLWSVTDSIIFLGLFSIAVSIYAIGKEKNKNVFIRCIISVIFIFVAISCSLYFSKETRLKINALKQLQSIHTKNLDEFVNDKNAINNIGRMTESCGNLIMIYSTNSEAEQYIKEEIDHKGEYNDFQYKMDVCVKLTAQRISRQDEFEDKKKIDMICKSPQKTRIDFFFHELCTKAGLIK